MTLDEKNSLLAVLMADAPSSKAQELAAQLAEEWDTMDAGQEEHTPSLDEGKPKTPLPENEDPYLPDFESEEDFFVTEEERSQTAAQTKAFLMGLISGFLLIGAGFLVFLAGRSVLSRLSELWEIPPDALIGISLLFILAILLRSRAGKLASRFAAWLHRSP